MYKVRDGKNLIRILPATWPKAKHYGYDIFVNYGIGVDNQSYLSLSKMKNEKDPLVEARKQAERDGDEKLASALQPRERIVMWIIDRNDEDEGPQIWAAPFTVDKDLANLSFDEDTKEVMFIEDVETGSDFRFYKEGQGKLTRYPSSKMKLLKATPLHEDEKLQAEWLDFIAENQLPDCLQFYDYDHIAGVFDGQARVEDDDEDEKPRKGKRKAAADDEDEKPSRTKRKPTADDDDEDEKPTRAKRKPADDDDDEEEKPSRSRSRLKNTDDDDEDEKERDDDDEDNTTSSIRDRLKRRRTAGRSKSDDDEDDD